LNSNPLIGYTIEPFQGLSPSLLLATMRAVGIAFVEFNHRSLCDLARTSRKMGNIQAAFHLPYICDDGYDFSCNDHEKEIAALTKQINASRNSLHLHHAIAHPPEGPDQSDQAWNFLLNHLKKLELPIYLENVFSGQPELFPQHYFRIQKALGRQLAGMCFDACHFFIAGQDPLAQWQNLHTHVGCVHLSDCLPHEDAHLPFNCGGKLPISRLLLAMKQSRFNGYITLEIKPPSLEEVDSYLSSYTLTLKHLHYQKYIRTRIRLLFIKPILAYLLN
jgi:sugar phosphate isomerase/epimerase